MPCCIFFVSLWCMPCVVGVVCVVSYTRYTLCILTLFFTRPVPGPDVSDEDENRRPKSPRGPMRWGRDASPRSPKPKLRLDFIGRGAFRRAPCWVVRCPLCTFLSCDSRRGYVSANFRNHAPQRCSRVRRSHLNNHNRSPPLCYGGRSLELGCETTRDIVGGCC